MARDKVQRELSIKFKSKYFGPKDVMPNEDIVLLHEEMQSIQLMDLCSMYQEDAAKKMNVSRPTFARILKSARKKISTALINGSNLKIHEVKNEFHVAVCSSSNQELIDLEITSPYIFIFHIKDYKLQSKICLDNPIYQLETKANSTLSNALHTQTANYFITNKLPTPLKNSLISKGIYPIIRDSLSIETIIDIFK